MTELLVGCPVRKREWVLPTWRRHVELACEPLGITPQWVFVVGQDDADSVSWADHVVVVEEDERPDEREWNTLRFEHMVKLRNALLRQVRQVEPELFLSLDSDILLHPQAMVGLVEVLGWHPEAWAVGGKCWMDGGTHTPSYGMWSNPMNHKMGITRKKCDEVRRVDVIMACKLMTNSAYNLDYEFHHWGEDLGWCSRVKAHGGELWWDGRYTNKHVMKPEKLGVVDDRCGY